LKTSFMMFPCRRLGFIILAESAWPDKLAGACIAIT
jgi:hypothetical protein